MAYSFVFFFKQKTAYEMRISDWSSDVCSSDLVEKQDLGIDTGNDAHGNANAHTGGVGAQRHGEVFTEFGEFGDLVHLREHLLAGLTKIGRASCRERVCQYV